MKKTIMGTALILLIGFTHASAAGIESQKGQPQVARNILSTKLPAALMSDIKNEYKGYWITACVEKDRKKTADYFITLENSDQTVQLFSANGENWVVTNTIVKEA
jgi:hypothetical protein